MTDTSIINLYFARSEQAIEENQGTYGGYCYRVAEGILNDPLGFGGKRERHLACRMGHAYRLSAPLA